MVILEELAFGLPIISTPVFDMLKQIPDVADAYFYSPGNVVQLNQRMLEVANDHMVRQRLSDSAKARFAEMPSFDQMLQAYESVLRNASKYAACPPACRCHSWCSSLHRIWNTGNYLALGHNR